MEKIVSRKKLRKKRNWRVRQKVFGTSKRPRLVVFVSNKNFYAQIIDDEKQNTLLSFSTLNLSPKTTTNDQKTCSKIGKNIALLALKHNIVKVVFDRAGFLFHGKIKSFASAARENGLVF